MAYATVEQLGLRFGSEITELLDRDGDDVEDAQVAAAILDDVSAEIDAILSVRYTVPIASAPLLVSVCCDLARYRLYDDAAPEIVKERQAQAIARITVRALRYFETKANLVFNKAGDRLNGRACVRA